MKFDQSAYNVTEGTERVQITLILSDPLSTNITIEVLSIDGSATGKQKSVVNKLYGLLNNNRV